MLLTLASPSPTKEEIGDRFPESTMNSKLWYREPASEWLTGLPIGNGVLGGMVMGTIPRERIALNHEGRWRGQYRDRDIDSGDRRLGEIRELFFAGKPFEAGTLANEMLGGRRGRAWTPINRSAT